MQAEAQARRLTMLSIALWGSTSADLQRQLLAPHPEIPTGFDLADFRRLYRNAETIAIRLGDPRCAWVSPGARSATIFVGSRSFTEWEARCEIVRRAIEYLEKR